MIGSYSEIAIRTPLLRVGPWRKSTAARFCANPAKNAYTEFAFRNDGPRGADPPRLLGPRGRGPWLNAPATWLISNSSGWRNCNPIRHAAADDADRLSERFVRPLAIDRVRVLVASAANEARSGRAEYVRAVGKEAGEWHKSSARRLDLPDWLETLDEEASRVSNRAVTKRG